MEPIVAQNVASIPQQHWCFIALPQSAIPLETAGWLGDETGQQHPFVTGQHGIDLLLSLPANTKRTLKTIPRDLKAQPFAWHPAIASDLMAVAPTMWLGSLPMPGPSFTLESDSATKQVWRLRWHNETRKVTVDLWATIWTQTATIEWTTHAVYGTTANDGQPQVAQLPALTMACPSQLHRDFAERNGHELPQRTASGWTLTLVPAGSWHRAVRHESRGAILPIADPARLHAMPMQAVYTAWQGNWLVLGLVPEATPEVGRTRLQQLDAYRSRAVGRYTDPRPRCQPRESGTTGDQPDFGAASDLAVTTLDPWEIHDALWQCQSYVQRPTANKEPGGEPMRAELHPRAIVHNQRPDLSYSPEDRLGWPGINQIQWIPSPATTLWTTSDDQHRADNFLHAAYLLTRDPALAAVIEDHIQLDKLDVYVKNDWTPAPRAVGRMTLTRANQLWLGFSQVKPEIAKQVSLALTQTPFGWLPPDRPVRTIGGREQAKYGWNDSNGQPVVGWQPWQEIIAAIGILAAGRAFAKPEWVVAANLLAQSVVTEAFQFDAARRMFHAYAIRWNDGQRMDPTQWPAFPPLGAEASNDNVYISTACQAWTMAAAYMVDEIEPKAKQVIAANPQPRTMAESRWRAV